MSDREPIAPLVVIDGEAPSSFPPHLQLRPKMRGVNTFHDALPLWIEEAAFVCYVKCNRKVIPAMRMLEEEWASFAPEGVDPDTPQVPPNPTWYAWRKRHDWDAKANQVIATNFPNLRMEHLARLVASGGAALDFLIGSAMGEFDHLHPGTHEARRRSSEVLLVAAGLGTHGSRDRVAPVVRAVVAEELDYDAMTEQELARVTLERIRATKTNHEERRR